MPKVTFVELSVYDDILPLVSGYLEAYARADTDLARDYHFTKLIASARQPLDDIASSVIGTQADVYALSCYVWNSRVMRTLVRHIRAASPNAHIMLGGPQVMHHGDSYLDRTDERLALCNGEGEQTFAEYLRELLSARPDLTKVSGLTCCKEGELVTTAQRARIADLNTIPSPFLTGLFDRDRYSTSIIETNRGCPFGCGFCYWGAATNDRVFRFDEQRVREEISWMAKNEIVYMFIADANWGMLGRDIEISRHIAYCAHESGNPNVVYFSAAKNKPKAVTQIVTILTDAGLIAAQPVSMQTLEPDSLKLIKRQNIKLEAFAQLQADLHERGVSSFTELIWPLPGETLESFKRGIGMLCERDAHSIISYGHLLLHNSPLYEQRAELDLVTRPVDDAVAEADIVIQTQEVSRDEFEEGMRYSYVVQAIQNTRAMRSVAAYLNEQGYLGYQELFDGFLAFWRQRPDGDPIVSFAERSIREAGYYDINNYGLFLHEILHSSRAVFREQLLEFARAAEWWQDRTARSLFSIDIVNCPYLYSNTPFEPLPETVVDPSVGIKVVIGRQRTYEVNISASALESLPASVSLRGSYTRTGTFVVDHKRMQYPFRSTQDRDRNGSYAFGMIQRPENMMPVWRCEPGARVA
jgi:tRNA A37 methylthiotransferase MiaB